MKFSGLFFIVATIVSVLFSAQLPAQTLCAPLQAISVTDCNTGTAQLSCDTNYTSYQWTPSTGLSNDTIPNPVASVAGTYIVSANYAGPNMVINPDFAAGNFGFTSGMTFTTVYSPCNYWVGAQWFQTWFPGLTDHTPTTDNMFMMIDGCTTPTMIWEEGTFTIVPGADYEFSFWATESGANQPTFEIHFIGNVTGNTIVSTIPGIPAPTNSSWIWDQYTVPTWNAGANTSVTIQIINLATQGYGVDFGMDDFDFHRVCSATDTVQVLLGTAVNLGPDTASCDVSGITLNAGTGGTYLWSTTDTTQFITPGVAGMYWVIFDDGVCVTQDTIVITALPVPVVNLGVDTALCDVSTYLLDAGPGGSYVWNTGDTTQSLQPSAAGTYWVSYNNGFCISSDTVVIAALPVPIVALGPDISLCDVTTVLFDAGPGSAYLWNTNDTTQTISPTSPGMYWVTVDNGFCTAQDTVVLTETFPQTLELGSDISLCDFFNVELDAGPGDSFLWSTGETTQAIEPASAGLYSVTVTYGSCTANDSVQLSGVLGESMVYIPNTVTPDGNSLNDVFFVYGSDILEFNLQIFNRWGELIYETTDPAQGWNCTYKGVIVQEDTYVYVVNYKTSCHGTLQKRYGHVNVVR